MILYYFFSATTSNDKSNITSLCNLTTALYFPNFFIKSTTNEVDTSEQNTAEVKENQENADETSVVEEE